jgi:hypothetical protein
VLLGTGARHLRDTETRGAGLQPVADRVLGVARGRGVHPPAAEDNGLAAWEPSLVRGVALLLDDLTGDWVAHLA